MLQSHAERVEHGRGATAGSTRSVRRQRERGEAWGKILYCCSCKKAG